MTGPFQHSADPPIADTPAPGQADLAKAGSGAGWGWLYLRAFVCLLIWFSAMNGLDRHSPIETALWFTVAFLYTAVVIRHWQRLQREFAP